MTEYYSSEGAIAANGDIADYSGNYFSYTVEGQFDAYYATRYAIAIAQGSASLTGNNIWFNGSPGADQVFVYAEANASENATATSSGNYWLVDLGEGDDASVIHTLAHGVGAGTVTSVSFDTAYLIGGGGADNLQATQILSALDGAFTSIESTARFVDAGDAYDFINTQVTVESGRTGFVGGSANYSYNGLYVNAGADGANIYAQSFISAFWSGITNVVGNYSGLVGGDVNAGTYMEAGNADADGGVIYYTGNSLDAMTAAEGGEVYAQNWLNASRGGFISFSDNISIVVGQEGADVINLGIGLSAGNLQAGVDGGTGEILNNETHTGGGAGDDHLTLFLNGWAEMGGSITISGNYFYGEGGEGDDTLDLNWLTVTNGGTVEFSGNSADLDGGAGSDTINVYLGEGISDSSITLFGGDGDDFIQSIDLGQNNVRLISGGTGNDTIVDDVGFSTVIFEGALAEYTFTALGGGWISVTDNRDGSPDGTDQLYQVDQLRFSDGDVLVADLSLPIEGTEGDDALLGSEGDDIINGYGGNDFLRGFAGNDRLDGGTGDDVLSALDGDDILLGGDGNDQLIGNRGADQLTGGADADRFIFGALFQSTVDSPDLITDFSGQVVLVTNSQGHVVRTQGEGDKIDLSFLDANSNLAGDQAFTLVQHGFSGSAGQAYSSFDAGTGITSLFLDVDGDALADMTIQLLGQANLTGADFIL